MPDGCVVVAGLTIMRSVGLHVAKTFLTLTKELLPLGNRCPLLPGERPQNLSGSV